MSDIAKSLFFVVIWLLVMFSFLIFQTGLFKNIFTIKSQLGYVYHRSLVKTFQIKEITFECVTRLSILTQIKITFK